MSENQPEPDPRSRFEDEGIPDLQEGTPGQQRASDPQEAALPGERPIAVDEFGTTAAEERTGEPLEERLTRERPDAAAQGDPDAAARDERADDTGPAPTRLVDDEEGFGPDVEPDAIAYDVGPDTGGYTAEEDAVHVDDEENIP